MPFSASVIVGNPPFAGSNKREATDEEEVALDTQKEPHKQKHDEKANQFLEHAIQRLKPGGYLAFIMPRSFASSQGGPATRRKLLEECDLLELWELPRELFQDVTKCYHISRCKNREFLSQVLIPRLDI